MRYSSRTLACLLGATTFALFPAIGCSSSNSATGDAGQEESSGESSTSGHHTSSHKTTTTAHGSTHESSSTKKKPEDAGKKPEHDAGEKDATTHDGPADDDAHHADGARDALEDTPHVMTTPDAKSTSSSESESSNYSSSYSESEASGSTELASNSGSESSFSESSFSESSFSESTASASSGSESSFSESTASASSGSESSFSESSFSESSFSESSFSESGVSGSGVSFSSNSSLESSSSSTIALPPTNYFMGRWDNTLVTDTTTGVGAVAEWPGSAVITTVTGPNVHFSLNDACNASGQCDTVTIEVNGVAQTSVIVGGITKTVSASTPITLSAGVNDIGVAGLNPGAPGETSTVGVYKNTDTAYGGAITYNGITLPGLGTNPTETYTFAHRIEWIGDDITAGTGDEGTGTCTTGATNSNEFTSAARIVSEHFNAEHHNISLSEVCVSDDCGTFPISTFYAQVTPDDANAWNPADFAANLVVINLGSYGDFATLGADPGGSYPDYEEAFEQFIATVRAAHASAYIILVSGPGWLGPEPNGVEPQEWLANALTDYQEAFPADTAVSILSPGPSAMQSTGFECSEGDPGVVLQSGLANFLETYITGLPALGWTTATWNQGQ